MSAKTRGQLNGSAAASGDFSQRERAFAVIRKLRQQAPATPEGKLCFGVVEQAIKDLVMHNVHPGIRQSARRYLQEDLKHAEQAGLEPGWVRRVISESGFSLALAG